MHTHKSNPQKYFSSDAKNPIPRKLFIWKTEASVQRDLIKPIFIVKKEGGDFIKQYFHRDMHNGAASLSQTTLYYLFNQEMFRNYTSPPFKSK